MFSKSEFIYKNNRMRMMRILSVNAVFTDFYNNLIFIYEISLKSQDLTGLCHVIQKQQKTHK